MGVIRSNDCDGGCKTHDQILCCCGVWCLDRAFVMEKNLNEFPLHHVINVHKDSSDRNLLPLSTVRVLHMHICISVACTICSISVLFE